MATHAPVDPVIPPMTHRRVGDIDLYDQADPFHAQQDGVWAHPSGVALVLDGLGGHAGSEFAVAHVLSSVPGRLPDAVGDGRRNGAERLLLALREDLVSFRTRGEHPQGTAAAVCAVRTPPDAAADPPTRVHLAWTGDCRAWRFDGTGLYMLTDDHDVLYEQTMRGHVSPGRAAGIRRAVADVRTASDAFRAGGSAGKRLFKKGNLMVSDLSGGPVDGVTVETDHGILLTTDGVHDNLTTTEMREVMRTEGPGGLIGAANQAIADGLPGAHHDDMSVAWLPPRT